MKLKPILAVGAAFVAGVALILVLQSGSANDETLIRTALDESIRAGKEGRSGSLLEFVSKSFEINETPLLNRGEVAKAISQYRPDVSISQEKLQIQGETATMTAKLSLKAQGPFPIGLDGVDATLKFAKEESKKWLVIPERKWRLTEVSLQGVSLPTFGWGSQ
jgi:hypothetical protein